MSNLRRVPELAGQLNIATNPAPLPPLPPPGRTVSVPIEQWLQFLEHHNLEVAGARNGVVIVKKIQPSKGEKDQ